MGHHAPSGGVARELLGRQTGCLHGHQVAQILGPVAVGNRGHGLLHQGAEPRIGALYSQFRHQAWSLQGGVAPGGFAGLGLSGDRVKQVIGNLIGAAQGLAKPPPGMRIAARGHGPGHGRGHE